jgi:hypothetical protein
MPAAHQPQKLEPYRSWSGTQPSSFAAGHLKLQIGTNHGLKPAVILSIPPSICDVTLMDFLNAASESTLHASLSFCASYP